MQKKLYHFIDEEYGLKNLANRRIKASTFDSLNDPFELLPFNSGNKNFRVAFNEMKRRVTQQFGILCFSEGWHSPAQWAHYANNHKGICLELSVSDDDVEKVDYVQERINVSEVDFTTKFTRKILLTKYDHWSYESEYRSVRELKNFTQDGNLYFQPFCEELSLTKVIIGCQSKLSREKVFESLAPEDKLVPIVFARAAFNSFKIVENKSK